MPDLRMPPSESWQAAIFSRLRDTDDWLRAGDVFNEFESRIPLHHATRHSHRQGLDTASPNTTRWRYFIHMLSVIGAEWERPRGFARQSGERIRLRNIAVCEVCIDAPMRKASWSSPALQCQRCRRIINPEKVNQAVRTKGKDAYEELKAMPDTEPHPLIGYLVTKRDERGGLEARNGTIIEVVPTNNQVAGDFAIIEYKDKSRIDLVLLAELTQKRDIWIVRQPLTISKVEAAE